MIISNKANDIHIEGNLEETGKMHINVEQSAHLIKMLTKAYADKIGSIVRESVANAKDSHTMANVHEPVITRIVLQNNNQYVLEVQDFGLGLDDREFFKYIMGIGESSKREIANVIGGLKMVEPNIFVKIC